jgi:hypothetical protein
MIRSLLPEWQLGAAAVGFTATSAVGIWLLMRKRLTEDEIETYRREMLVTFGRIVDGQLLDSFELTNEEGATRQMLLYTYEIAGVSYECSQDISPLLLKGLLEPEKTVKVGMLCSIRYQPGSPENSILVAEGWSGLRTTIPSYMPLVEQFPFGDLPEDKNRPRRVKRAAPPEPELSPSSPETGFLNGNT